MTRNTAAGWKTLRGKTTTRKCKVKLGVIKMQQNNLNTGRKHKSEPILPTRGAVAEATMFELIWYDTTKMYLGFIANALL
jgi:hypothetical protein